MQPASLTDYVSMPAVHPWFRAYCHAELAVSFLAVVVVPSPKLISHTHVGMARLSWPGWSVRLSVRRVDCDKTEERSVQIFIPYERGFRVVF